MGDEQVVWGGGGKEMGTMAKLNNILLKKMQEGAVKTKKESLIQYLKPQEKPTLSGSGSCLGKPCGGAL